MAGVCLDNLYITSKSCNVFGSLYSFHIFIRKQNPSLDVR